MTMRAPAIGPTKPAMSSDWGRRILGEDMARPIVTYLIVVAGGSLAFIPTSGPGRDVLSFVVLIALALVPALVVNAELVRRFATGSWRRRAIAGAAAWTGWYLFVAIVAVLFSRVVFVPRGLVGPLVLSAAIGAVFSVVAFRGRGARPGLALAVLAFAVITLVFAGGILMAGRWSSAV